MVSPQIHESGMKDTHQDHIEKLEGYITIFQVDKNVQTIILHNILRNVYNKMCRII